MNDRDCARCKHYKEYKKGSLSFKSCEQWECDFEEENNEPKELSHGEIRPGQK